jgi:uncharacterized protein (DUF305 family)
MNAAADLSFRERCKPALDLVETGRTGWSEVRMEAPMTCEPGFDRRNLVSALVVHHQMDIEIARHQVLYSWRSALIGLARATRCV